MYCIQLLYRDERFVVRVGDLTDLNHFSLWTYVFRVFVFFNSSDGQLVWPDWYCTTLLKLRFTLVAYLCPVASLASLFK